MLNMKTISGMGPEEFQFFYGVLTLQKDCENNLMLVETFPSLTLVQDESESSVVHEGSYGFDVHANSLEETTTSNLENKLPLSDLECEKCGKKFKTKQWFSKHIEWHVEGCNFTCKVCGKDFQRNSNLKAHTLEIHSQEVKFKCEKCSYTSNNKSNFKLHLRVAHSDVAECGNQVCQRCGKKYFRADDLSRHMIREHGAPRLECDICAKTFISKQNLSEHRAGHFNPQHLCAWCGKLFTSPGRLRGHIRTKHSQASKHECPVCSKVLSSKKSLTEHLRCHSGDRPYPCTVCNKSFATAKYLRIHLRSHTKERPYSCEYCNKGFTQKSSLTSHLRYHTGETPFQCPLCEEKFVGRSLLKTHVKSHQEI